MLAILVLPWALPSVVSGVLWRRVFDPDNGLLNSVLLHLHVISEPHVWLASGRWAIAFITVVHVWGVLPLVSLIFLAGLQSIPEEVYNASAVDGAGAWRQFRYITLPLLRPSIAVALTIGTLLAIAIFDEIYVLNGTALNTRSILIQVYNTTFVEADFAHGTALAFLLAGADGAARRGLRARAAEVDAMTRRSARASLKAIAIALDRRLVARADRARRASRASRARPTCARCPRAGCRTRSRATLPRSCSRARAAEHAGGTVTEAGTFSRAMGSSDEVALIATAVTLVVSTMAAYAFGRLRFRFGRTLFWPCSSGRCSCRSSWSWSRSSRCMADAPPDRHQARPRARVRRDADAARDVAALQRRCARCRPSPRRRR